ncbi:hypothetical protein ACVDG3_00100 [Meridianimarinicoccus sp. RP-17]|uniref:hypothetical protein n=1 Tax=Meridianimarinicoccus zhengii TaxID=2056810 RepID=UPI0013A70AE8|nr:hypothetical protein [Phycocomes zhengii]
MTRPCHTPPDRRPPRLSVIPAPIPTIDADIDLFLASVGFGFNPGEMRRAMRPDALRLSAKSDAELARLGIRRDEIPAYVLRHRLPAHAPVLVR